MQDLNQQQNSANLQKAKENVLRWLQNTMQSYIHDAYTSVATIKKAIREVNIQKSALKKKNENFELKAVLAKLKQELDAWTSG